MRQNSGPIVAILPQATVVPFDQLDGIFGIRDTSVLSKRVWLAPTETEA